MYIPWLSRLMAAPFKNIPEYNEKLKDTAWAFQQAFECYVGQSCHRYKELAAEVLKLKDEALLMYQNLWQQVGRRGLMPRKRAYLFKYITDQKQILDSIEQSLNWMTCRQNASLPEELAKELFLLVDAIIDPVEELIRLTEATRKYFRALNAKSRRQLLEVIQTIEEQDHEAHQIQSRIHYKAFNLLNSPSDLLYVYKLSENIAAIARQARQVAGSVQIMMLR